MYCIIFISLKIYHVRMDIEFDKIKLGKRIKELRLAQSLSQDDLCDRTEGLDPTYLSKIETGKFALSVQTLLKILNALNINPDTFFQYDHLMNEAELDETILKEYNNLTLKDKQNLYRYLQIIKECK